MWRSMTRWKTSWNPLKCSASARHERGSHAAGGRQWQGSTWPPFGLMPWHTGRMRRTVMSEERERPRSIEADVNEPVYMVFVDGDSDRVRYIVGDEDINSEAHQADIQAAL